MMFYSPRFSGERRWRVTQERSGEHRRYIPRMRLAGIAIEKYEK